MGKKNRNKKKRQASAGSSSAAKPEPGLASHADEGRSRSGGGGGAARLVALGLLVLGVGFFAYAILGGESTTSSSSAAGTSVVARPTAPAPTERQYRYYDSAEEAKPFPVTMPPSHFQNAGIANAYAIAKEIPDVLSQQPCLCGCDNQSDDHASLLDCFVDEHASTCAVCLKEAVLAKQMTEAGEAAAEIRASILRHEFSGVSIGN